MPTYHYKVKNADGNLEEGDIVAEDRFSLSNTFRGEGKQPISIVEVEVKKGLSIDFKNISLFSRIKLSDKILFARNLSAMVEAGLPLSRALGVLERQSKNAKLKKALQSIAENITKGNSLSDSLSKQEGVFSQLEISMVHVGEESGNLTESLNTIAVQLEKSYSLKKKIKSAMMYPMIIMFVMVIIAILMLIFVVPTLTAIFKDVGMDLPMSTQLVIVVSDFMKDNAVLVLVGLIIVGVGGAMFAKTTSGKRSFDFVALHMPIISTIVKEYNTAQTSRTLASLLSSGVGVVEAITITGQVVQNSYYKKVLKVAIENVQKGVVLSESFVQNQHLYPPIASEMIQVGEETGQLSNMLHKIATYYEDEVDTKTKDLSTVIEPFLMVVIGGGVGFFAISMISPMYSLTSAI
jgi:type IV pilus assembly protein PilC